jgi:hypothetical protein
MQNLFDVRHLIVIFFIRNGITSTESEADAKGKLRHYQLTAILDELLDNKSAVLTPPSHGVN